MSSTSERLKKLQSALKKETEKKNYDDTRFWSAELDNAGDGEAVIRFLPEPAGEDLPYVKVWSHGFKVNNKWYIENCPTTIGQPCPVCDDNGKYWNDGEEGKAFVQNRKSKRKLSYISNILVVNDPKNPQNNGKVFLFKYGKKIYDKMMLAIAPEDEDETPIDIFDLATGADFKLKIKKVAGYANFDTSSFKKPSAVDEDDREGILKSLNSLSEFIAPDKFKSYDDLKTRLDKILHTETENVSRTINEVSDSDDDGFVVETTKHVIHEKEEHASVVDDDELASVKALLED